MEYLLSKRIVIGITFLFLLILMGCEGAPGVSNFQLVITLNYPEGGDVTVTPLQLSYPENSEVILKADANEGWNFIEWAGDASGQEDEITITMDADKAVEANFAVNIDPDTGFAGGEGTENEPYLVGTVEQIAKLGDEENLDGFFKQIADIDFSAVTVAQNKGWEPIGDSDNPFSGTYDGNNRRIRNLTINRPGTEDVGLFGYSSEEAIIKNVNLLSVNIVGGRNTGGLVGFNSGEILNCFVDGNITGLEDDEESLERKVGGLVGENNGLIEGSGSEANVTGRREVGGLVGDNDYEGVITDSFAKGEINAEQELGGLVGANYGEISNSFATGKVETINYDPGENGNAVGGLVGSNDPGGLDLGKIINCYATGEVLGDGEDIGGLVGNNRGGEIRKSFATGNVTGLEDVGGLVGRNTSEGLIENCYALGKVSGSNYIGGLVGNNQRTGISPNYRYSVIDKCYSIGEIIGDGGGLLGRSTSFSVYDSYWDLNTSGKDDSDFGEGRTTKQLQAGTPGDILDEDGNPDSDGDEMFEGWDSDIWDFGSSGEYPSLKGTP